MSKSFLFLLAWAVVPDVLAASNELARIREQFRAYHLRIDVGSDTRRSANPPSPADAVKLAQQLSPDGSWPDVDYRNEDRSAWAPARHVSRMLALSAARCALPGEDPGGRACADGLHAAFGFWMKNDFQCPNWWWNRIGVPKTLGTAALLLGEELKPAERAYLVSKCLPRAGLDMTGQNRVWLAGITALRGLLLDNQQLTAKAANVIWRELVVTTSEGVQPDFSFHQHGPQQQFGNYGLSYANDMVKWMTIFRGTSLAPDAGRALVLHRYMNEGLAWTVWNGRMDANCVGRQFGEDALAGHGRAALAALQGLDNLEGVTNRAAPQGSRFFWRSELAMHRRPEFMASLKMSSRRVIGSELVNSENLSGYLCGDGVLLVTRTGEEYENIFPLWDWRRLPGITAAQSAQPPPRFANSKVDSVFVGGVSDGTNTCAAFDYARDGVRGRKAWFFLEDQVVCLGAGIQSTNGEPVATSVNQCWKRGAVEREGDSVLHDEVRYLPLGGTKLRIADGPVTGSWLKVRQSAATPVAPVTGEVFSAWIDHGVNPENAGYAYAILPGARKELLCQVLSNTTNLQAVADDRGNLMAIFHAADSLRHGGHSLTVDQPCLVLIQPGEAPRAYVADPTQTAAVLSLAWDGHYHRIALPVKGKPASKGL